MSKRIINKAQPAVFWFPNAMVDEGHVARMGPKAWAVYSVLRRYEGSPIEPSPRMVADLTGLEHGDVTAAVMRLIELGYLEERP